MRQIWESRAGTIIVSSAAAIAAGAAITAGIATGVFSSPPPACYVSAPTDGSTVSGNSVTLTATCGASTNDVAFQLNGTAIASDGNAPFTSTWNSATVANGTYQLTVLSCDVNQTCIPSGAVSVTTNNNNVPPQNTVAPVASGSAVTGNQLSCTQGTWTGDTSSGFTYRWKDDNGNIASATSSTYTIGSGEVGLNVYCAVTATGTGGSTTATSNTLGPVVASPGPTTGNVWISASGNDTTCKRSSTQVSYTTALNASPTNVCTTLTKAYQVANLGDQVLVEGAPFTVTSQTFFTKTMTKTVTAGHCNYNYGASPVLDQCVTIEPASGQSLVFDCSTGGCTGSGSSPGYQIRVCVSGLAIENATITETDWTDTYGGTSVQSSNDALLVGQSDNTCGSTIAPHDDLFENITYGGRAEITGGVSNVYLVGGTAVSDKNLSWLFGGFGNNGTFPYVNSSGIIGVTFQGYNFISDNARHMECVHANGNVRNSFFANSRYEHCPVESLFFETLTSTADIIGNTIENNYFDSGNGGGPFKMDCANSGCTFSNNIVRFNSFSGGWSLECSATTGNVCNMNNNTFYGNLGIGCQAIFLSNGGTVSGTGFVDQGYNVQSVAKTNTCTANTSAYSATITYVSPGSPNYNLDLSGAQTATNFVPNSVTWPLPGANIYGAARSGANTNAGAD